jgi:hypothetical protein
MGPWRYLFLEQADTNGDPALSSDKGASPAPTLVPYNMPVIPLVWSVLTMTYYLQNFRNGLAWDAVAARRNILSVDTLSIFDG